MIDITSQIRLEAQQDADGYYWLEVWMGNIKIGYITTAEYLSRAYSPFEIQFNRTGHFRVMKKE